MTVPQPARVRRELTGTGCLALIFFFILAWVLSDAFWSWLLMLFMGAFGPWHWSFIWTATHWGALAPFVLG